MSLETTHEFFEIAGRQGLLPLDTVRSLQQEATSRQIDGASLVLQKGLLSALDVEIIETLRQPATAIPGYEIDSIVGRGGMGVVYRARQVALDRTVAIKMVLVGHSASPSMLARFEQEAQTVGKLLHPHIITAYDFGRHEGRLYFAMEYVEGEDADRYVRRLHPLTEQQVWPLIRQAATGLAHASESGIVHRDIKPANLLLVPAPRGYPLPPGIPMVKIADFGLAFLSTEVDEKTRLTSEQSTLGSPNYMAPEQLNAGSVVDQRADIYSLGATAYHLLAGRPPFDGLTLLQIIARKLRDGPLPLRELRPDLTVESIQLIDQMLAGKAEDRIGSYAELLNRIDTLPVMSAGAETKTLKIPVAVAGGDSRDRRPWIVAGLALAAILIGVLSGLAMRNVTKSPATSSVKFVSNLKETGWSAELFDGNSLRGWRTLSGTWNPDTDDEGARIIAGTGGEILRPILKVTSGRPERLAHYRVTVAARLHQASAIELHFNVDKSGSRDVVRLTLDRIAFGHRADSRARFEPRGEPKSLEAGADRLHELRLERDVGRWQVYIDDTLVDSPEAPHSDDLPEFRLAVEGGPAWFSDMYVEELAKPESPR
jgi:serine/threonine-protein kinase